MKETDQINDKALEENISSKLKKQNRGKNFRSDLNKSFEKTLDESKILKPILKMLNMGVIGIFILVGFQALEMYLQFGN